MLKQEKLDVAGESNYGLWKTVRKSIAIIIHSCGIKDILLFSIGILTALLPSAIIYLQAKIFSQGGNLFVNEDMKGLYLLIIIVGVWGSLRLSSVLLDMAKQYAVSLINAKSGNYMTEKMLLKTASMQYGFMDLPEVFNKTVRISNELLQRITKVISSALDLGYGTITFVSVAVLAFSEDWVIAAIIIAGGIPACIFTKMKNFEEYYESQWNSVLVRRQWDVKKSFSNRIMIKEMRIGQYNRYMSEKWETLTRIIENFRYKLIKKYALFTVLSNISRYGCITAGMLIICVRIADPNTSADIGSFVLIYSIGLQLQTSIAGMYESVSNIGATGRYLKDFDEIMQIPDEKLDTTLEMDKGSGKTEKAVSDESDIVFNHVTFTYQGNGRPALNNISLRIRQGEKIAIVGENGSGKSTFVSLLCGLYLPDSGSITVNGIDTKMSINTVRKLLSVVFQDFGKYELSIKENILIGHIQGQPSQTELREAAMSSGADDFINKLEQGYETILGTMEKGTADLSGGQWQKLAFARALVKKSAKIMVLDEQTASLDPISEAKFYSSFKEITGDRTTIMISHRLGATLLADRILVFNQGEIAEEGSHIELMRKNGLYAKMYDAQAQWYTA